MADRRSRACWEIHVCPVKTCLFFELSPEERQQLHAVFERAVKRQIAFLQARNASTRPDAQ